jgi:MOSC domain-containing protein YiiM|uniref:MOSC domain-containing protein n=1 Tax=Polynucleobacter sp. TaxID=2029855 RepID=UPI004047DAB9
MMRILSISSGTVSPLFGAHHPNYHVVPSAINKKAISTLENPRSVEISSLGVLGDEQADLSVHGGIEKAIYVYPSEHYHFWNSFLTRETNQEVHLQHGAMGENFTIEGLLEADIYVGDQLNIGELVFIVTKLREPCFKFNVKMKYKGAAKAMLQSAYSGWYLRVSRVGHIAAGATIDVIPGSRMKSIAQQNSDLFNRNKQQDLWD